MDASGDQFRLMYDTKGRFTLHRISDEEKGYKLCRVNAVYVTPKKIPVLTTHDGRTVRYPDPSVAVHDTVKLDIATGKIVSFQKFEVGKTCTITKGRNTGRVGTIMSVEKHPGSFHIGHIEDINKNKFATRLQNVFSIGADNKPWVSLPKGKGIKLSIIEERTKRLKQSGNN